MKLYYAPGACSLAVHIVLREAGQQFTLERVDLNAKKTEKGRNYREVNPKGSVPALELDSGEILTEAAVCLQYVADLVPDKALAPLAGTMARYRVMEWLNYISSELHKQIGPLFHVKSDERREEQITFLQPRFEYVAQRLAGRDYLMGKDFTIADAYLYAVLNWTNFLKIDISRWQVLKDFITRVASRGAAQDALKAEGLR